MVKLCSIKGCKKKVHGHGYCNSHYHKNRTYGNPLHIVEPKKRGSPSEETRKKIGESNKITANRFWKSLTKEEKAKRIKKPGFFKKGQTPWVKGKKATSETRKKQSHSALLRFQTQKHPHQGTHRSEETKEKLRKARLQQKPMKNTVPEKLMRKMLKGIEIKFEEQKGIKKPACQPDFYLKPKICIFVDGDFTHANPKPHLIPSRSSKVSPGYKPDKILFRNITAKDMWKRDRSITRQLKKEGYKVLRFWHSELEITPNKCIKKILKIVNS